MLEDDRPDFECACVIVAYNPDFTSIAQSIESLAKQVGHIFLIDNGSEPRLTQAEFKKSNLTLIRNDINQGIAAAQNTGIKKAVASGAKYVVLMDHDSMPQSNMVSKLKSLLVTKLKQGEKVAAIGPVIQEKYRDNHFRFVRLGWTGYKRCDFLPGTDLTKTDLLIASGTMIPIKAIEDIGYMQEDLFIDHVDHEWCMRAIYKGYLLYGANSVVLSHSIGLMRKSFWFLRWREIPVHNNVRYYYMYRNTVTLCMRKQVPAKWKFSASFQLFSWLVFLTLFVSDRKQRLRFIFNGLVDGMRGKLGPISSVHE